MDLKQRVINALSKSEENQGLIIAIKILKKGVGLLRQNRDSNQAES